MTRAGKALVVLVVAALGLWGCAQGPSRSPAAKIKRLESKCTKLENDYRAVAAIRDGLRKKLADREEEISRLYRDRAENEAQLSDRTAKLALRTKEWNLAKKQSEEARTEIENLRESSVRQKNDLLEKMAVRTGERDDARKKAEETQTQLERLQERSSKEKNDLLQQITMRTNERDTMQTQLDQLRAGMRSLLGRVDAALKSATQPTAVAVKSGAGGKS